MISGKENANELKLKKKIEENEQKINFHQNNLEKSRQSKKIIQDRSKNIDKEMDEVKSEILKYTIEMELIKQKIQLSKQNVISSKQMTYDNFIKVQILEKTISRDFEDIKNRYNWSLTEKLSKRIDIYSQLQKKLNINYIIIKKLDFSRDFLNEFRLSDDNT
jgi:hypothetical protein